MKRLNIFFLFLFLGLILRILITPYGTFGWDMLLWKTWSKGVDEVGFSQFYYNEYFCDYLPGYIYVLWLIQKIHISFPNLPEITLFKLPSILADLGISLVIFYSLKPITDNKRATLSSLAYFFNPASISNSTLWGQVDAVNILPLLISILLGLRGKFTSSVSFAILGFMIKPLSIVIFPIIGFLIFKDILFKRIKKNDFVLNTVILVAKIIAVLIIIVYILSLPFIWDDIDNIISVSAFKQTLSFVHDRFNTAYNAYMFTSVNAFNFWGMIHGMWASDQIKFINITYQRWGTIIFFVIYSLILISLFIQFIMRGNKESNELTCRVFQAVTLTFFALFLFVTRVHERHFLPTIAFFTLLVFHSRLYCFLYTIISLCYVFNMYYSHIREYSINYPTKYFPFKYFTTSTIEPLIPLIVIILFAVFLIVFFDFILNTFTNTRSKNNISNPRY